jgi:OOP family OmpA-OmpF porin
MSAARNRDGFGGVSDVCRLCTAHDKRENLLIIMSAMPDSQVSQRRYRRRILGWGTVVVLGIFAVGAAVFMQRVEDDLERRVIAEFDEAGVGPVTAGFSGQDGTLRCLDGPVAIPDDLLDQSRDLWGVSSLDVAPSCSSDRVADDATTDGDSPGDPADTDLGSESADDGEAGSGSSVSATSPPSTDDGRDLTTVAETVANDSQFSTLAGLLGDVGLDETLASPGPVTLFAPTNEAFEALGPEVIAALGRDADTLTEVLSHHVTAEILMSDGLVDSEIEMLDGTTIEATTGTGATGDGVSLTSGDSSATVVEVDLLASNGVVHAVDHVLLPAGLVIGEDDGAVLATVDVVDGQVELRGTVAGTSQRDLLVAAAGRSIDAVNVIDELDVDTASVVSDDAVGDLAEVAAVMGPNLISGQATLTGSGITLAGVYADDDQRAALEAVDVEGITFELTERQDGTADGATAVEADLNALVAANPILFEPNSAAIDGASNAILDRVAALASRLGGLAIEIQGHTDTDGVAASNVVLSEGRAESVRAALVERGLDGDSLTTVGFGGTDPILDAAGVEDKAASRRVEFVVTVQPSSS